MEKRRRFTTIDAYLKTVPADARAILAEIRQLVKTQVPDATETISYQMPAFRLGKVFIYFAAFKHHIGIYPPVEGDKALQKALLPYRGEKGNLKFALDEPVPYPLIERVIVALAKKYGKGTGKA